MEKAMVEVMTNVLSESLMWEQVREDLLEGEDETLYELVEDLYNYWMEKKSTVIRK
jgi:hypothetical protein